MSDMVRWLMLPAPRLAGACRCWMNSRASLRGRSGEPLTAAVPRDVRLLRRGFALEYATLGWNVAGIAVLVVAVTVASGHGGLPPRRSAASSR